MAEIKLNIFDRIGMWFTTPHYSNVQEMCDDVNRNSKSFGEEADKLRAKWKAEETKAAEPVSAASTVRAAAAKVASKDLRPPQPAAMSVPSDSVVVPADIAEHAGPVINLDNPIPSAPGGEPT